MLWPLVLCREQLRTSERQVRREAAEAVIKIQQAAVKSRQGSGTIEDVQATVDSYAQKLQLLTGSSDSGGLKPGDMVVVPSLRPLSLLPLRVAKVGGEAPWHQCLKHAYSSTVDHIV